jgi:hypothetical protein
MSKLTNKEEFLVKSGKSLDTINFCKKLKVPKEHLVWFVDRIEKESFPIHSNKAKEHVSIVLKMFSKNKKIKTRLKTLSQAIFKASQTVETDESESKRILHKFPDGHYIINLTHKEAYFEGKSMRNCMASMSRQIQKKEVAILALKNKSSKTLSHIQIGICGNLEQHYNFANSPVNFSSWHYINEFFEKNKSLDFENKLKEKGLNKVYDISSSEMGATVVNSRLPYEQRVSFFEDENKESKNFNSIHLKKHSYFYTKILENQSQLNIDETISYLEKIKKSMLKSFQQLEDALKSSKSNLYILNEETHYIIFGKKINTIERFKSLIDRHISFPDKEEAVFNEANRPIDLEDIFNDDLDSITNFLPSIPSEGHTTEFLF